MGRKANCSYFIKYPVPPFFFVKNQIQEKLLTVVEKKGIPTGNCLQKV